MVALGALVERFKSEPVGRNSPQIQIPQFAGDETQGENIRDDVSNESNRADLLSSHCSYAHAGLELRKYLHGFFRFDIPESYYIQLYIIIGVVSILICWGIAIIVSVRKAHLTEPSF